MRLLIRSALPGVVWPAITGPAEASALALQYQLERSQWLQPGDLEVLQLRQLDVLLRHAWLTVPFYRWQWHGSYSPGRALTRERFERLPLLRRENLQHEFGELRSNAPPAAHGAISETLFTGSHGVSMRTLVTALAGLWMQALTLRDHLWHGRDFDGTLAVIREGLEAGQAQGWGPAAAMIAGAGRSAALGLPAAVDAQLEWLAQQEADYLLTCPSNALELARRSIARGIRFPALREVLACGSPVDAQTCELCRQAWDVPLTGLYSTGETGPVALQCPEQAHYHVQSESVLVEVLDAEGKACAPGAPGRIVVTTLQNFALPLVRYDLGDWAEIGDPCPCGRGLPVLRRVVGRARNGTVAEAGRAW